MTTKLTSKTLKAIQIIALKANENPNCKFTSLIHLLTEDFLKECFRELKRNKSPGIIPKPNGDKRPLGIPAVEDKIVQMAIKKILEAIFEQDFMDTSYGFRPNRGCHDALSQIDKIIMKYPVNFIVEMYTFTMSWTHGLRLK